MRRGSIQRRPGYTWVSIRGRTRAEPDVFPLPSLLPLGIRLGLGNSSEQGNMSTTSPEEAPSEPSAAAAAASAAHEPLACVNCRSRKLKCEMLRNRERERD
jgi:hypothetical protein